MSNQEWWAAERKAAEFWRKVEENQMARHDCLNHGRSAAPTARNQEFGTPKRPLQKHQFGYDGIVSCEYGLS